jgi:inward rectifier potassium channel
MANRKTSLNNLTNSFKEIGFGSKSFSDLDRLILEDGSFNVKRKGIGFRGFSLYHWLIYLPWFQLIFFGVIAYVIVNIFFATVYLILGQNQLSGYDPSLGHSYFLHCFYFSTQTLTTVGFGSISPLRTGSSLLAAFEAMVGLLGFAFATSVIYGRFSKAKSKIVHSKTMVISPYRGIKGLKFRIANSKRNQLIEMSAKVMYSFLETENGIAKRKYLRLPLEIEEINMFPLPWTIVHPLDETSPLVNKSADQLKEEETEIIVILKGYDDTFNQYVHKILSYRAHDILFDHDFEPMFDAGFEKSTTVYLNKIDAVKSTV